MSCEEALELLSGHLDGENTPEQEAALSAHLTECEACGKLLLAYEEIDKNVAALQEPVPEGLAKGIMYRIDVATGKQKRTRKWFIGPGTALGAIAAVLLLLIGTGKLRLPESKSAEGTQTAGVAKAAATEAASEEQAELTQKGATFAVSEDIEVYTVEESNGITEDGVLLGASQCQALPTLETMLSDEQYAFCTNLSAQNTAAVLVYQGVDDSFFTLLNKVEPDFTEVFSGLTKQTKGTKLVYRTSFSRLMALQEWFDEWLPKDEEELQDYGWDRFAQEDPENSYLTTYIQKKRTSVQLSEQWPENWAQQWRLEQNWALFYPDTSYQPQKDDTAYIVLLPAE